MKTIIEKLQYKVDEQGYLPYPYAMRIDKEWKKGLIHIDFLRNYLKDYGTLDGAIENTKSEGLKLLLMDLKKLD